MPTVDSEPVGRALKPLIAGVLIGVVGTLLVAHFAGGSDKSIPERLEEALHCDDGVADLPAAIAHHTAGFSEWAVTHANRISGIGCDAGPATVYMQYSPYGSDTNHALATLDGYGPVCVVDHGFFDGRSLNQGQLPELCDSVGGKIAVT